MTRQDVPGPRGPASPVRVAAPLAGRSLPLADVPDPVFAEGMVGPGVAVDPERTASTACAPVAGRLLKVHPHAFVVVTPDGRGVLVHLGIDTVQMRGEGFRLLAAEGDEVETGSPVVAWDPAEVERSGRSPVCPVVALDAKPEQVTVDGPSRDVRSGDVLFAWR